MSERQRDTHTQRYRVRVTTSLLLLLKPLDFISLLFLD